MQNRLEFLNEEGLTNSGWQEVYHHTIHLPENILNGYHKTDFADTPSGKGTKVTIVTRSPLDFLLYQLLRQTYQHNLHVCNMNTIPNSWTNEQGWLIISDFYDFPGLILDEANVVLIGRNQGSTGDNAKYISVKQVSVHEQLGTVWGTVCKFLDKIYGINSVQIINRAAAFCMEKAGALASGMSYQSNLAKLWAEDLANVTSCRIVTPVKLFEYMAAYWQEIISERTEMTTGTEMIISLQEFMAKPLPDLYSSRIFYADGDNLINQLLSQYYFVNITAIYSAILKEKKYK